MDSWINKKLIYLGKSVTVIAEDTTHVLIQFESGTKIATSKSTFENVISKKV